MDRIYTFTGKEMLILMMEVGVIVMLVTSMLWYGAIVYQVLKEREETLKKIREDCTNSLNKRSD